MDADREESLLFLLEWEEQRDRWLGLPEADRIVLVRNLARLMVQMAEAGTSDEYGEDQGTAS